jgi:hypothetical protein
VQAVAAPLVQRVDSTTQRLVEHVLSVAERIVGLAQPIDGAVAPVERAVTGLITLPSAPPEGPTVAPFVQPEPVVRSTQRLTHYPATGDRAVHKRPIGAHEQSLRSEADADRALDSTQPSAHMDASRQPHQFQIGSASWRLADGSPERRHPSGASSLQITEVVTPAGFDQQPTHLSEWTRFLAAHSLLLDDALDDPIGFQHGNPADSVTPAHHSSAHRAATTIESMWATAAARAPLPFNRAEPFSHLPIGATPAPATASGSISLSGGGSQGGAPPMLADLSLAATWRPLWRQARLRPTGIVLPSLAPPG